MDTPKTLAQLEAEIEAAHQTAFALAKKKDAAFDRIPNYKPYVKAFEDAAHQLDAQWKIIQSIADQIEALKNANA